LSAPGSLLDAVLPRFDASERHEIFEPARPAVVFAAVEQVTVRDVCLLVPLMRRAASRTRGRTGFPREYRPTALEGLPVVTPLRRSHRCLPTIRRAV
jgi:hypothetical protein